jgi:hypothetical protein
MLNLDRVHIFICPHIVRGQSRLLLGQLPGADGSAAVNDLLFGGDILHVGCL